jgi:cytochrome c553
MIKFSIFVTISALAATLLVGANAFAAAGKAKSATCAGCHGVTGISPNAQWPNLAGQSAKYLASQLRAFKSKARNNAQMAAMVAGLSETDMDNLAAYYAAQTPGTNIAKGDISVGEKLYRGGDAARQLPACMSCHGPGGQGMPSAGYPAVAGQHAAYSQAQLAAFKSGERAGGPANMMSTISAKLSDDDMKAVSEYMAGLR